MRFTFIYRLTAESKWALPVTARATGKRLLRCLASARCWIVLGGRLDGRLALQDWLSKLCLCTRRCLLTRMFLAKLQWLVLCTRHLTRSTEDTRTTWSTHRQSSNRDETQRLACWGNPKISNLSPQSASPAISSPWTSQAANNTSLQSTSSWILTTSRTPKQ